ncbi:hypothetical protein BH24ACT19_BH24ACT19_12540 [soil metagenome]|jgi:membrane-bound serine protease (ClpP class)
MVPVSWIGVALILLALVLFAVDLKVTSHGLPAAWGVLLLVLAVAMVSGVAATYPWASFVILVSVVVLTALLFAGVVASVPSAGSRPVKTGAEGMIGEVGVARSPIGAGLQGRVFVHGERWRATLATTPEGTSGRTIKPGQRVQVVGLRDGEILVLPYEPAAPGRLLED